MIDLGPHADYIVASYAAAGLVLGLLIGASVLANLAAARRLAALEAREASKPAAAKQ
ncbi:MAG: hypothetical protein FD175_1409 [Beijerinckiaceae bacterium]|nr:MAG: hypothetical protein FD175_1409 [Beijerinckiaceae bacterium]